MRGNYDDVIDPLGMNNGKVIYLDSPSQICLLNILRIFFFSCFEVYGDYLIVDGCYVHYSIVSCSGQLVGYLFALAQGFIF